MDYRRYGDKIVLIFTIYFRNTLLISQIRQRRRTGVRRLLPFKDAKNVILGKEFAYE